MAIEFDYLAKKVIQDKQNLKLQTLYQNYTGSTQILTFQGDKDFLINHSEKELVMSRINNSSFVLVTEKDIDHIKYKSNSHGLSADFLELFSYALEFEKPSSLNEIAWDHTSQLGTVSVSIDKSQGLPIFNVQNLNT